MKTILAVLAMVPTLALADEPGEGRNGANEAISARSRAGAEFDRVTAPPVLNEEVPAPTPAPTQLDEPAPEVPTTPEEEAVAAEAAEEFARQPGETRTDHVRRLLEERALLHGEVAEISGNENTVIQVIGWDNEVTAEARAQAQAEAARLDSIDGELRALRAKLTALETALEAAQVERRQLRTDLDALDARVTSELQRIDTDTEFLAGRIADHAEAIEAQAERIAALEAADVAHAARLDDHEVRIDRTGRGTRAGVSVGVVSRLSPVHGQDTAFLVAGTWGNAIGDSAWVRQNEAFGTYHPGPNHGLGAGYATRFLTPVSPKVPALFVGPELAVQHAMFGVTDGTARSEGFRTSGGIGIRGALQPVNDSFTLGCTVGGEVGLMGRTRPDVSALAPGVRVGCQVGWAR